MATAAKAVAEVEQEPQEKPRHHRSRDAHQIGRHWTFVGTVVDAVVAAKSFSLHHRRIAAVASSTGLRQKHVEVMVFVISSFEAISTNGHARRCSTSAAAISDNVGYPDETAFGVIIIATNCKGRRKAIKLTPQSILELPILIEMNAPNSRRCI